MTEALDPLIILAQEHIDQIADAKALLGPISAGERFLRGDCSVKGYRR